MHRIMIPDALAERIDALRFTDEHGKPSFGDFVVAMLEAAVTDIEENMEYTIGDGITLKVVPDPTMPRDEVKVVNEETGEEATLKLDSDGAPVED